MTPTDRPTESNPGTLDLVFQRVAVAAVVLMMGGLAVLVWLGSR